GNQVTWYYKGAGHPRDYQFRAYPVGTSQQFPKDVIANVWNWDKAWKVEWLEDGKPMGAMVQYTGIDPYADQVCTEKRKTIQGWIAAASTNHLFRATPTRADAEIEIQVTDRFGQVYRQKISK
ncbi:calcineurin-like phosphoesterase C-terminal domain-containing protein, partial [Bacteroides heparinolyticus]